MCVCECFTVRVGSIIILVDQIDAHTQILLVQNVPFVVLLERRRLVLNVSVGLERIGDALRLERYVGQIVLVAYST